MSKEISMSSSLDSSLLILTFEVINFFRKTIANAQVSEPTAIANMKLSFPVTTGNTISPPHPA